MATVNSYTDSMPTPDRTSLDEIVDAARDILEIDGLPGLTMQAVAQRVGVRAPSLYKRVQSRDDLVRLVAEATLTDLASRLPEGVDALTLATEFRRFAHQRPAAFQLVMTAGAHAIPVAPEYIALASAPILRVARELAGEEHALEAARTFTAWANGFISTELAGGFNLGGDVEAAWEYGAKRLVAAISR